MKLRTALKLLLVLAMVCFASAACADVWLPASLTEIESQAFMNASWLSGSCTIPEGTQSIGAQAFYNCSGITSLSIADSVTYIGPKAFAGCTGLSGSVTIPKGCEVAADAFEGCTGLTVITEEEDHSSLFTWKIIDGKAIITAYKGGKDVTSVTVPATLDGCPVTAIDAYVFASNRYLTHISLPSSLESIGNYAFAYCSRLSSISMPESVRSLGRYAFYYSSALAGQISLIDATIPSNAFTGCKKLDVFAYESNEDGSLTLSRYYGSATSVTVPYRVDGRSVTVIGREAFSSRTTLQEVRLPSSVTTIGQSAFYYCTALRSVHVPYGVKEIGPSAFYNCTALSELALPESIETLGSMAFHNCTSLNASFSFINASVNTSAFSACEGVTAWIWQLSGGEVALEDCISTATAITVPSYVLDYPVTGMVAQAFYGCKNLTSLVLPENLAAIPSEAFYKCTTLQSVSIPQGVASIGEYAFYGCSSLGSVTIPATVSSVGSQAFYNCSSMTNLTVCSGATQLMPYAFGSCSSLRSVSMPGDYSNVGNMSFNGTPWLNAQLAAVANEVTDGCGSDYDRALALHDWLVSSTAYDLSYTHYGSEGVLFHGLGVCNAYTITYSRMLDAVGISNMTVTGTATDKNSGTTGSHAWTLVQLDGAWYHVDTTWDDPIPDGRERHTYFCLTDEQIAEDHVWNTSNYPAANGSLTSTASVMTLSLEDETTQTTDDAQDEGVAALSPDTDEDEDEENGRGNTHRDNRRKRR